MSRDTAASAPARSTALRFDIARTVRVGFSGDAAAASVLQTAFDPWEPVLDDRPPDLTVEELRERPTPSEVQNPAGDGLVTGSHGSTLYVRVAGRWCRVPPPALEGPFVFAYEQGFPIGVLVRPFLRSALQIVAAARGAAVVHGAAAVLDGKGVVVAGWSESGKTETVLALMEDGARFLSDKWTFVRDDGSVACFPISAGIRRWMLDYAPRLREALPVGARAQLRASAAIGAIARSRLRKRLLAATAGDSLERLATMVERLSMSPTALAAAYGAPAPTELVPLGALVLLTTTADGAAPTAALVDPVWAARRLTRSATYERRRYLDLARRARYADVSAERVGVARAIEEREERRLVALLEHVPVIEARTPFPCDPRRIVAAIHPLL